jgi:hypothetical protein
MKETPRERIERKIAGAFALLMFVTLIMACVLGSNSDWSWR